jgi:hypothetical protein
MRTELIARLGRLVCAHLAGHTVHVAIDGPDAAGKTMLADDLAEAVRAAGPARELRRLPPPPRALVRDVEGVRLRRRGPRVRRPGGAGRSEVAGTRLILVSPVA